MQRKSKILLGTAIVGLGLGLGVFALLFTGEKAVNGDGGTEVPQEVTQTPLTESQQILENQKKTNELLTQLVNVFVAQQGSDMPAVGASPGNEFQSNELIVNGVIKTFESMAFVFGTTTPCT